MKRDLPLSKIRAKVVFFRELWKICVKKSEKQVA